jgi:hypothetical protein
MKIRPMEAQFFHADWRMVRHEEANSLKFCERA